VLFDPKQWPALSRLLDQALDLPRESRERWLESLPVTDLAYKEELRNLLRHGAAAETHDFLEALPNLQGAVDGPQSGTSIGALKHGATVGPYVVEREIASGGMGAVWLARRGDGLIKRLVALKLPHTGPADHQLAERFASERDILAELAHPNIARLYDAGFSDDGQPFLALEYVAGAPLTQYCDQHRLTIRQRLKLFQQVLGAVQYAHSSLVIHRDLKPSNVIVGSDGRAMLLDFGIARLIAIDTLGPDGCAAPGAAAVALTPDYASPEQISGQPVTTASDIYSLGVLLFELLTGERPYRLTRGSRAALEKAILTMDPPRPSQSITGPGTAGSRGVSVKRLRVVLRGDLDNIVLKALKKSPGNRYATADAFLEDIDRYLKGEPVVAHADGGWYRTRKFFFRHKMPVLGGGVALLAVVATAAIAVLEARAAAMHARGAAAERDRAVALSSRNEAVADFLNVLITEAGGSDKPVTIGEMLARSEALVTAEYRGSREHRAAVLDMLGVYYRTVGDSKRGEALLQSALQAVQGSGDADLRRKVTCDLALAMGILGEAPEATRMLQSVVSDPGSSAAQSAECLAYLSDIAEGESDAAGAVRYGTLALRRLRTDPQASSFLEASILASLGDAERLNGHSNLAVEYFRRSLDYFARAGRDRGPDAIVARNNLAVVSDASGNPKRSLELYDETLRIAAQNEPAAPASPVIVGNRARALELIGRYQEARDEYLRCVVLSIESGLPPMHLQCLTALALLSRELGDTKSAQLYLKEATDLAATAAPVAGPGQVALQISRGRIELLNGAYRSARNDLDRAIAADKSIFLQMTALAARAELSLDEGRLPDAESDARQALALAERAQGGVPHSNRTGLSWLILGRVLAREGDNRGSQQALDAAVDNLANTVDADHPMLLLARQLDSRGYSAAAPAATAATQQSPRPVNR
jgi:eukaryotic-like serine/threonine-protein kinase